MDEYRPNSHKFKEGKTELVPEKKIEKVVTGAVQTRKKSGIQKFAEAFLTEDMSVVKDYILTDVLIPAIKNGIWNTVSDGLGMALGIDVERSKKSRPTASRISYGSYFDDRNQRRDERKQTGHSAQSGRSFDDIVFDSIGDAELVLEKMEEILSAYGVVSVADLYDMAELDCPHTYNKYGWTNLASAKVRPVRGGYVIDLPRAMPLN